MRRMLLYAAAAILAVATLGAAVPACFKPDHPACAFSCADPPHTCPSGYTCGADNLCHDPLNTGYLPHRAGRRARPPMHGAADAANEASDAAAVAGDPESRQKSGNGAAT